MLVELLLKPVNVRVARTSLARIGGVRGTARTDEHRGSSALSIVQCSTKILGSHINMHEHGLWPARCRVVAVRRCQRDNLEQAQDRPWDRVTQLIELRERLLDWKCVGAGVQEQALHTLSHQCLDVGFGRFRRRLAAQAPALSDLIRCLGFSCPWDPRKA